MLEQMAGIKKKNIDHALVLMHFDGNLNNHGVDAATITNNSLTLSTASNKFGTGAILTPSNYTNNGYLSAASSNVNVLNEFTFECWFNYSNPINSYWDGLFSIEYTDTAYTKLYNHFFQINNTNAYIYWQHQDGSTSYASTGIVSASTWHHFALTKKSGTIYFFYDGLILKTITEGNYTPKTISASPGFQYRMIIGNNYAITPGLNPNNQTLNTYYDELRIGAKCKWTAPFTVPAYPYVY